LAAVFIAELGDVSRFAGAVQVSSWAGLTPKHRESDLTVHGTHSQLTLTSSNSSSVSSSLAPCHDRQVSSTPSKWSPRRAWPGSRSSPDRRTESPVMVTPRPIGAIRSPGAPASGVRRRGAMMKPVLPSSGTLGAERRPTPLWHFEIQPA
jgi:hypothetical protein